jgi:hypothetical protein
MGAAGMSLLFFSVDGWEDSIAMYPRLVSIQDAPALAYWVLWLQACANFKFYNTFNIIRNSS